MAESTGFIENFAGIHDLQTALTGAFIVSAIVAVGFAGLISTAIYAMLASPDLVTLLTTLVAIVAAIAIVFAMAFIVLFLAISFGIIFGRMVARGLAKDNFDAKGRDKR